MCHRIPNDGGCYIDLLGGGRSPRGESGGGHWDLRTGVEAETAWKPTPLSCVFQRRQPGMRL